MRIECRIGGADLNPYLAFAALIAAGLKGIDEGLSLSAPFEGDAYGGEELPEIILEPGRSLIANAGILVSEVVLVARKARTAVERWVYTDVGKFSGLIETMDESIKFPIWTEKKGEMEEVIIAGPTCDSADIMYENYKYGLPLNLASGDRLYWFSTGAYTTSYSSIEFNGFPPLEAFYV